MSRKSDLHNHLSRRISKKGDSLHTVTTGTHRQPADAGAGEPKERPFKPIQYDASAEYKPTNKSIFGL